MSGRIALKMAGAVILAVGLAAAWMHHIVLAVICGVIAVGISVYARKLGEQPDA